MDNIENLRVDLMGYTLGKILPKDDLMNLSQTQKLQLLQITPDKAVKKREVGGKTIPYVPVGYVERALNFVSNFRWGCKVQREGYKEYTRLKEEWKGGVKTGNKIEQKVFDAWVVADFWIELDGFKIERSCYGMRQMFENPATSDFSCMEAARSMATKSFADTLGIASDKLELEDQALQKYRKDKEKEDIIEGVVDGVEERNAKIKKYHLDNNTGLEPIFGTTVEFAKDIYFKLLNGKTNS